MEDKLPSGWIAVPLAEVVLTTKGRRPHDLGPRSVARDIPYVTIATFETGAASEFASEEGLPRISAADTLIVWDGARAGLVGRSTLNGYAASTLVIVSPVLVDPDYLHRFLEAQFDTLNSRTKGAGIPHVDKAVFEGLSFPLAPLPDQRAIVEWLNQALTQLELARAAIEGARRDAERAWTATLAAAMRGELTAGWRREQQADGRESGTDLLARLLLSRPPTPELSPADLPGLPLGWGRTTLGAVFDISSGGTPNRRQPEYWGGGIPWVSSGEVRFNRIVVTRETVTAEGLAHSSARLHPPGTVLLGMIGQGRTRGQVAVLDIEAATNQNCAALGVSETEVPSEFIFYWLWSRYDATRETSVGNNQPALNRTLISAIPLAIPPIEEMRRIIELLEAARGQAEQLGITASRLLDDVDRQRDLLFAAAFSGTITSAGANDEPANLLLERIREVRLAKQVAARNVKPAKRPRIMLETIEAILREEGGWVAAPDLFRRSGVLDETSTDEVEARYRELMDLDREGRIETEAIRDDQGRKLTDRIRLRDAHAG